MIDIMILALALSMDAFAVAIGLGAKNAKNKRWLAMVCALYFGVFQALMPLIGFLGGKGLLAFIGGYAHWVAFVLLVAVGGKMIFEALTEGIEEDIAQITHKVLLALAIATSIDAMAAGFTLHLLAINPWVACAIIGVITFLLSALGVFVGAGTGTWLESKAELLGGITLLAIGFKVLLSALLA